MGNKRKIVGILLFFSCLFLLVSGVVWHFMGQSDKEEVIQSAKITGSETTNERSQATKPSVDKQEQQAKQIEQQLAKMSLEEKVGQLFFVRTPDVNQVEDITTYHLGGYVLFGRDIQNMTKAKLQAKIEGYQKASKIPLLIGADEEGGTVTRISRNANLVKQPFRSPQAIYQKSGLEGVMQDIKMKSLVLKAYGISTGLFPVADVATDPQAFIYERTLGTDAATTSEYIAQAVKTLNNEKVGSTLKHFPGYGNNRDSHVEIVTDARPIEEFRQVDFQPFIAGIKAGADSILVSHTIVQAMDSTQPASISPAVHEVLRQELGFQGVIITDDMDMAGLAQFISQKEAGLKALQAGNDLVMSSSYQTQIPYVIQAVKSGDYNEQQLNMSVKRVLEWKQRLGLLTSID